MTYLEPLLIAYDDKLDKLEYSLKTLYEDMHELEKKSEGIVEENNFLRKELETKCEYRIIIVHNRNTVYSF
jgi:regulator of replication initiation timing